jgi:hypothetical protein
MHLLYATEWKLKSKIAMQEMAGFGHVALAAWRRYNIPMKIRGGKLAGKDELRQGLRRRARALRRIAAGSRRYLTEAVVARATQISLDKLAVTYQILAEN